jgi:hypothetical protein
MHNRSRSGTAWLAVLALLINALLPASLSVAAPEQHIASGWCGSAPGHSDPVKDGGLAPCERCILCCTAAPTALEPPAPAGIRSPTLITFLSRGEVPAVAAPQRSSWRPAQPRGPPGAVRV